MSSSGCTVLPRPDTTGPSVGLAALALSLPQILPDLGAGGWAACTSRPDLNHTARLCLDQTWGVV